jgi:hypothetical protein
MKTPAVYINPNAPMHIKDFFDHFFPDVQRVSAMYFQELTGGFTDEGPAIGDYAAVIIDEEGEIGLYPADAPAHHAPACEGEDADFIDAELERPNDEGGTT